MKNDLKNAKVAIAKLYERGEKERYIDKCDLEPREIEILKRALIGRESRIQIASNMHMSPESVQEHYRRAIRVLHKIIEKYT